MLKGQAKKDYQRGYMRAYRRKKQDVRPPVLDPVQPMDSHLTIECKLDLARATQAMAEQECRLHSKPVSPSNGGVEWESLEPNDYLIYHSENIVADKEVTPPILIDADGNRIYED